MSSMFERSTFNGDISEWNTRKVVKMDRVFCQSEFKGDLSSWDTSCVTGMSCMFESSRFNGDISKWNVSNVWDMSGMFYDNPYFEQDISAWTVHPKCNIENAFLYFHSSPLGMACALQRGTPVPPSLSAPMSLACAVCESLGLQGIAAGCYVYQQLFKPATIAIEHAQDIDFNLGAG